MRSEGKDPSFLHAENGGSDAKADLSLLVTHSHTFGLLMSRPICSPLDSCEACIRENQCTCQGHGYFPYTAFFTSVNIAPTITD